MTAIAPGSIFSATYAPSAAPRFSLHNYGNEGLYAMLTIRIFLSSPGDVAEERRLAIETMRALEDSPLLRDRVNLQLVAWDDPAARAPLDARETPQASVNRWAGRPADCDLTIAILWSRLGTPLPANLKRVDGSRFASGTVWEVEDAMGANRPVFVYRRTEKPRIELDDVDFDGKRAQYDAVRKWFDGLRDHDGAWRSGVNEYASPAEFQSMLRTHLEVFIGRSLADAADGMAHAAAATPKAPRPRPQAQPPDAAGIASDPAPTSVSRRWLVVAGATALAVVATFGWLSRSGTPPASAPLSPAYDATASSTSALPSVAASAPLAPPPAAQASPPRVQLAGPSEAVFSKMRSSTYIVLALTPEAGGPGGWRLRIRVRLTTAINSGGMNFWDSSFRLLVDGVPRAPDSRLNEIVDGGASKDGDISFDVPNGTQTLALRVLHYGEVAELPLTLSGAPPARTVAARPTAGPRVLALAAPPEVVFTKPTAVTFTVLGVASEARRSGIFGLRIRMRMSLPAGVAANFWDDHFRLLVDGVPRAPDSNLNLVVEGGAALDGDVTFEVPDDARSLVLRIVHHGQQTADLPLTLEVSK